MECEWEVGSESVAGGGSGEYIPHVHTHAGGNGEHTPEGQNGTTR